MCMVYDMLGKKHESEQWLKSELSKYLSSFYYGAILVKAAYLFIY